MTRSASRLALAGSLVLALSACGNDDAGIGPLGILAQTAAQTAVRTATQRRAAAEAPATAPKSPAEAAAEALRVNPGPLIQAGFESLGRTQVMAMAGQNGDMRTFMTPAEEALILRNGLVVGTRGMGNDLSVAEPGTEALIRAGASGTAPRVMRYFSGDGLERPLQFSCTVGPGPNPGVVVESCKGHGATFRNNYLVQNGRIAVSRQWIGPGLGYVTIQVLRP